jgi:hypothetical protein
LAGLKQKASCGEITESLRSFKIMKIIMDLDSIKVRNLFLKLQIILG